MYISRLVEKTLKNLLKTHKIIIILGARQVGKTTLIEYTLKQQNGTLILNFDVEVDKARFVAAGKLTPEEGLKSLGSPKILVIDEAQRLLEVGRVVKGWYDMKIPVKIILLGSSSLNLLNQSAESLTGRNEKIYLPPLMFFEILKNQSWYSPEFTTEFIKNNFSDQIKALIADRLVYGSYPEVVTTENKERYLINLVSDYLLKDILQLGLIRSSELVKKLLMLLAYQIGSEVSVNELARTLRVARPTVERYLELLEKTFVIFRLPAFSTNPRKEISKSNKIFFWDTGVRNALLKEFSLPDYRSDIGGLWENWVIAEVAKKNLAYEQKYNLYFWRTRQGSEVDLVIKGGRVLKAYEIKWSKSKISSKTSFSNRYNANVELVNRELFLEKEFLE